jgi:DNA modification methylase
MQILNGNNLDLLKTLPDNSVDSIVTDPPYGLSFMNKKWDYDVPSVELWKEVYRVLKHGGHVLSFGGTRTYHRMVVNMEDAGFEIRDQIMWLYGSGFPKSLNIGKAIDKRGGESIGWFIDYILDFAEEKGISKKDLTMLFPSKNGNPTGWLWNKQHNQSITLEQYNTIKDFLGLDFPTLEEAKREIVGVGKAGLTKGNIATFSGDVEFAITAPSTEQAKKWEGWGTALKPANEPICLARKPLSEKSVAENVLKHGTGGINIDGCRVGSELIKGQKAGQGFNDVKGFGVNTKLGNEQAKEYISNDIIGRFPANVIHDGSDEVVEGFPNTHKAGNKKDMNKNLDYNASSYKLSNAKNPAIIGDEGGSASRFFYCAKASKGDRNEGLDDFELKEPQALQFAKDGSFKVNKTSKTGVQQRLPRANNHPTVKPTELMRYLCRLITPPNGVVLDPFMGSGSTGKGAILEGFDFIGMELDPEYVEIAKARIEHAQKEYSENQAQQKLF